MAFEKRYGMGTEGLLTADVARLSRSLGREVRRSLRRLRRPRNPGHPGHPSAPQGSGARALGEPLKRRSRLRFSAQLTMGHFSHGVELSNHFSGFHQWDHPMLTGPFDQPPYTREMVFFGLGPAEITSRLIGSFVGPFGWSKLVGDPKTEPWQIEPRTKTCGFPGGLTHTHFHHS